MSTNKESGNQKNIDNFKTLTIGVESYGIKYKPSNTNIALLALQGVYATTNTAKIAADTTLKLHRDAILTRKNCFTPIPKLATRVFRALKTSDVDDGIITQAKSLVAKIRGERITPIRKVTPVVISLPQPPVTPVTHSVSQQSFTNMVDHLAGLILILDSETNYKPNEADLSVVSLQALQAELKADNDACDDAMFNYNNAITIRNLAIYNPKTGICDLAATTKNYVSQLFGLKSPEYKAILRIKFVKLIKISK